MRRKCEMVTWAVAEPLVFQFRMRAALIYQHATTDRDRSIADALSELVDLGRAEDSAPRTRKRTARTARPVSWPRWRNSTLIARTVAAALLMIERGRRFNC
jgi:hypothetical protein